MNVYHEIVAKALKGSLDLDQDLKTLEDLYLSYGRPKDPWSLEEILTLIHRFPLAISKALLAHCKTDWYHVGPQMVCTRIYPLPSQEREKAFWEGIKTFVAKLISEGEDHEGFIVKLADHYPMPELYPDRPWNAGDNEDDLLAGVLAHPELFSDDLCERLMASRRFILDGLYGGLYDGLYDGMDRIGEDVPLYEGKPTKIATILFKRPSMVDWCASSWRTACPSFGHFHGILDKFTLSFNSMAWESLRRIHLADERLDVEEVEGWLKEEMEGDCASPLREFFLTAMVETDHMVDPAFAAKILGPGFFDTSVNWKSENWSLGEGLSKEVASAGSIHLNEHLSLVKAMALASGRPSSPVTLSTLEELILVTRNWDCGMDLFGGDHFRKAEDQWSLGKWIRDQATHAESVHEDPGLSSLCRAALRTFPKIEKGDTFYQELMGCSLIDAAFPKGWMENTDPNKQFGEEFHLLDIVLGRLGIEGAMVLMGHPEFTFSMYDQTIFSLVKRYLDRTLKEDPGQRVKFFKMLLEVGAPVKERDAKILSSMGIDVFAATQASTKRLSQRLARMKEEVDRQQTLFEAFESRQESLLRRVERAEDQARSFMGFAQEMFGAMQGVGVAYEEAREMVRAANPAFCLPPLSLPPLALPSLED